MELIRSRVFSLKVHWTGIAACVALILLGFGRQLALTLAALLIHEGAHIAVAALLRLPIRRVELTPFGGMAEPSGYETATVPEKLALTLAGVTGSLLAFGLARLSVSPMAQAFARLNLSMAVFNLLPVLPLDGGRAIYALCEALPHAPAIRKCMLLLATALGMCMLLLAGYGAFHGAWNLSLIVSGPYLCYAARQAERTQGVLAIERGLRFRDTLRKRGAMPVTACACSADMTRDERLRQWLCLRENRYRVMLEIDPATGELRRVLDESSVISMLLDDESLRNHHKSV